MPVPDFRSHPNAPAPPDPAAEGDLFPPLVQAPGEVAANPAADEEATTEDNEEAPDESYVADDEEDEEPGITMAELHEELIAATTEARRGDRRMLEVLKNFGAVLDALSATVNDTHKAVRTLPTTSQPSESGELPRDWALALVEMADRLDRVADGFARPPAAASSWWPGARQAAAAWREAWAMQADALGILRSHLESLLQRAALVRLEVVGCPFDPATMTAVESVVDPDKPDHSVLAELLPGWRHATTRLLIRPAQVQVSRLPAR